MLLSTKYGIPFGNISHKCFLLTVKVKLVHWSFYMEPMQDLHVAQEPWFADLWSDWRPTFVFIRVVLYLTECCSILMSLRTDSTLCFSVSSCAVSAVSRSSSCKACWVINHKLLVTFYSATFLFTASSVEKTFWFSLTFRLCRSSEMQRSMSFNWDLFRRSSSSSFSHFWTHRLLCQKFK